MKSAFLALLLCMPVAHAQVTLDQIEHPALLIKTSQPGVFLEAPTVSTDIKLVVRGIVARGVVKQTFSNNTDHCAEAVYVFPLADHATIDAMRMRVGVRTIEGQIKERQEAAKVYEEAKNEGKSAALLEQHRPNLFTVSLASLPAGETAEVEIEYQEVIGYDGQFSLRVPLAIGPRYQPADSGTPVPALYQPLTSPHLNPVTMDVDLDGGIALDVIKSPTHDIDTVPISGNRVHVKPRNVTIASDRDFVLNWTPRLGSLPQSAAFSETVGQDRYTLLMLFPPDVAAAPAAVLPRNTIFIIDTSGSMEGQSLAQAKQALLAAIDRLRPTDRFNIIEFNDDAHTLFRASRNADSDVVQGARGWIANLKADGGTNMLSALPLALEGAESNGVKQVVFITDGQVGNEPEVFEYIRTHLGKARIFTVGLGHAPNSFFLRNAARAGRGTFTQIDDVGEVGEKMKAMFRKLEAPVLSNVDVRADAGAEVWPKNIPDLYAGEPLVVTMRTSSASTKSLGRIVADGFNAPLTANSDETQNGIARLWARQKIDALRDSVFTGSDPTEVRKNIVALALEHHLVTEHTSLVAVDTTPAGVDPKSCTPELVPINLPEGWGGIEGSLPQTATNATLSILIGLALVAIAGLFIARSAW